jgi:outer membrane protein assembly factor BamB
MHRFFSFPAARLAAVAASLPATMAMAGGGLLCGTAADELVAARAGLVREWVVQIPFDSAGWSLEHVSIGDGLVVATSGDGGVHAVSTSSDAGQPRPGSVIWSRRIGRPGGAGQPAGIGSDLVTVAHDLDIHALHRADGSDAWRRSFGRPPSGGAVPSGDWAYAPLSGDGVMRLPTNPNRQPVVADADRRGGRRGTAGAGDSAAALKPLSLDAAGRVESAAIAYEGGVVWCTESGRIVAVVPADKAVTGSEWARIEFELNAPPAGPLVVRGSTIYAATTQGDLARIDDLPPNDVHEFSLTWHVVLPQPPEGGPLVGEDTVAISLGDEGIVAFSAASGEQRWRSCAAGRLVSITGQRLWSVDRVGRLAGLDLATGMPAVWLCLGSFTLPVANTVDGRLILASPDGLMVSLAPRRTVAAAPPSEPPQPNWKPGDEGAAPAEADEAAPVDTTAT